MDGRSHHGRVFLGNPCPLFLPWMTLMDKLRVGFIIHHHIYLYINFLKNSEGPQLVGT